MILKWRCEISHTNTRVSKGQESARLDIYLLRESVCVQYMVHQISGKENRRVLSTVCCRLKNMVKQKQSADKEILQAQEDFSAMGK